MTHPQQPTAAIDHARHDTALIAALADRKPDLEPRDLTRARELVAQCEGCRDLLADLVIIRDAIPASATPARPRGFTLSEADARRLMSTGWRRFIGFFGSARDAFSRPLAIGFTTIGIVALVVTSSPFQLGFMGSSGAAPVLSTVGAAVQAGGGGAGGAAPQPAASAAAAAPSTEVTGLYASAAASAAPAPSASSAPAAADAGRTAYGESYASGETGGVFTGSNDTDVQTPDINADDQATKTTETNLRLASGPSLGIVIGGFFLILGFGLFALRWTSRRLVG
jgi:hypothetical protein